MTLSCLRSTRKPVSTCSKVAPMSPLTHRSRVVLATATWATVTTKRAWCTLPLKEHGLVHVIAWCVRGACGVVFPLIACSVPVLHYSVSLFICLYTYLEWFGESLKKSYCFHLSIPTTIYNYKSKWYIATTFPTGLEPEPYKAPTHSGLPLLGIDPCEGESTAHLLGADLSVTKEQLWKNECNRNIANARTLGHLDQKMFRISQQEESQTP